jgi:Glycosyltransferase family 87
MPIGLVICYGILFAALLVFWTGYVVHQSGVLAYAFRTDFLGIYVGAHSIASGHGSQLYDLELQRLVMNQAVLPYHRAALMAFIYPAYVAVLLAPLGFLSFIHAVVAMLIVNALIAVRIAWILATRFSDSPRERLTLLFGFLALVPLHLTLLQNQLGLFPALGILEAALSFQDRKPVKAGCWLLLGIMKPQLIVFPLLALILWQCWRALLPFVVGCATVLAVSVSIVGWWVPDYLSFLGAYNRAGHRMSLYPQAMQNWRGLASVLFRTACPTASQTLIVSLTLLSVLATIFVCRYLSGKNGPESREQAWEAPFALIVLLGILSSPHLYSHDWVVLVPAAVYLQRWARSGGAPGGGLRRVFSWLLAGSPFVFTFSHFIGWSPGGLIQWIPWYMGALAGVGIVLLRTARLK